MKRIYLASPYSGTPKEQEHRFREACRAAAHLIGLGNVVYSPIAHSHPIAVYGGMEGNWQAWERIDRSFLEWADEVLVLAIPGWETSKGIKAETDIAWEMRKEVNVMRWPNA